MKFVTKKEIRGAVECLKNGGVVVFPTETSYGLAADAKNSEAVKRVFAIKGREAKKTPPLITASRAMTEKTIEMGPVLRKLAKKYWPGPFTVVAPVRKEAGLAKEVIRSEDRSAAVRVSSHPVACALARGLGRAIVATSANLAGAVSCYSIKAFKKQLGPQSIQPDVWLDAGVLPRRNPSALVAEKDGKISILRQGSIRF